MPLYEYDCRGCGRRFETLVKGTERPSACPTCGAEDLERALSTFAVAAGGASASESIGACGRCGDPRGPGACSLD